MYSNPKGPEICANIAFVGHSMYNPNILSDQTNLFEDRSQYERFIKIFRDYVNSQKHHEEFVVLGMTPAVFRTHLIQKGATTHISAGSMTCPLPAHRIDLSPRELDNAR